MALRKNLISNWSGNSGPSFSDAVSGHNLSSQTDAGGNGDGVLSHSAGLIGDAMDNTSVDTGSGNGNLALIGGNADFNSAAFSISLWFKGSGAIATLAAVGGDTDSIGMAWRLTATDFLGASNAVTLNDGSWHHLVGTCDGTTSKYYVDGSLQGTNTASAGTPGTYSFALFGFVDSNNHIVENTVGLIDEVAYAHRAWTAAEVTSLYNSGAGLAGPNYQYSLHWATQPSNAAAGASITPSPAVELLDEAGNRDTSNSTNTVSVAIGTNPSGGTLSGTTPTTLASGLATFSDLSINNAGTGYTLTASTSLTNVTGATSSGFDIASANIVTEESDLLYAVRSNW